MQRVAIVGYGAVARVHASHLRPASVYGPDARKASEFAAAHGIGRSSDDLGEALEGCDAAIICSPGPLHFEQALAALDRVGSVLVELPACSSEAEAVALAEAASKRGAHLHCAHTSRYLRPFRMAREWTVSVTQVRYVRSVPPRTRSWTDDALQHHAAHPLDVLRWYFGAVEPVAMRSWPRQGPPQDVALLAALPNGAPLSVSVSYVSRVASAGMTFIGTAATVETDGFSFLASDQPERRLHFDAQREYEEAIACQDAEFLAGNGVPWTETIELVRLIDRFRNLEGKPA